MPEDGGSGDTTPPVISAVSADAIAVVGDGDVGDERGVDVARRLGNHDCIRRERGVGDVGDRAFVGGDGAGLRDDVPLQGDVGRRRGQLRVECGCDVHDVGVCGLGCAGVG